MMRKISERRRQWMMQEILQLEAEGVLSTESAGRIRTHYETNTLRGVNWAVIVFSILGSVLIGAGIILLFAHNWDELTRQTRAVLSFCPLAFGALLSILALIKNGGVALRESAGIFHSLAIGATISLIGQTYHLPSNVPGFLLSWSLLALPLMFLLQSTGACLIYLALLCGWSSAAQETYGHAAWLWLLILPPIGWLIRSAKQNLYGPEAALGFAGMIIALCISLGTAMEHTVPGLWIVTFASLLSGIGLLGLHLYEGRQGWNNIPGTFGMIGIVILAYILTWEGVWREIGWHHTHAGWNYPPWGAWLDGGITLICVAWWIIIFSWTFRRKSAESLAAGLFPVVAGISFLVGSFSNQAAILNALIFNGYMLFLGIMYVVMGCRSEKLRQLNSGMVILALLLITRFFDTDFGYLARGIVFIALGTVFLVVNLIMVRRKSREEAAA